MNITPLFNQGTYLFKESILPKFTPLQKKIGLIALAIFSWIAICYAVIHRRLQLSKPVPAIDQLTTIFKRAIPPDYLDFNSGVFFVWGKYDDEIVKQQYLFKNEDGSPVKMDLSLEMDKIGKSLKATIHKELENAIDFKWFLLIKKDNNKFYQINGNYQLSNVAHSKPEWDVDIDEGEMAIEESKNNLKLISSNPESLMKDGEFFPGEYYKNLKIF